MHRMTRTAGATLAVLAAVGLTACEDNSNDKGQKQEAKVQQSNYDALAAKQPAHGMTYSPTRESIQGWVDVWNKPGQLAYVYLKNANGDVTDYFVMKHPPVSMCTSLTPNYKVITPEITGDNNVPMMVPAPGIDGVYYSGGECNTFYGFDATTGAYMQYTAGMGINVLLFTQPLPPQQLQDADAHGQAAAETSK